MPRILFLHGLRGSPAGKKVQRLRSVYGLENVVAPSLGFDRGADGQVRLRDLLGAARLLFDGYGRALRVAADAVRQVQPDVIVGASLGGGIALRLDTGTIPLVLVAPAWKKSSLVKATSLATRRMLPWPIGVPLGPVATLLARRAFTDDLPRAKPGTLILHAAFDEVIPMADSRELVEQSGLPPESLIEAGLDHGMNGDEELDTLLEAVARQLGDKTLAE